MRDGFVSKIFQTYSRLDHMCYRTVVLTSDLQELKTCVFMDSYEAILTFHSQ